MSGFVDHHPLARDLPEYKQDIHDLKTNDNHFSRLLERYEALDKEIVRAEQGLEHRPDLELDGLKMQRVELKDELAGLLRAHKMAED